MYNDIFNYTLTFQHTVYCEKKEIFHLIILFELHVLEIHQ